MSYSISVSNFISNINVENFDSLDVFTIDFKFSYNDVVFKGHYPFHPVFPASLVVELTLSLIDLIPELVNFKLLKKSAFYKGFSPGDLAVINIFINKKKQLIFEYFLDNEVATRLIFDTQNTQLNQIASIAIEGQALAYQDAYVCLPQRFPLLVVDQVYANQEYGSARKNVSYGDLFYQDAYGDIERTALSFSKGALVEGVEQSAVLLLTKHWDVLDTQRPVVVCAIDECQFFAPVYPGDIVEYFSYISYISESTAFITGYAVANGHRILDVGKLIVIRKEAI